MNLSKILSYWVFDNGVRKRRKIKKLFRCYNECNFCKKKGHTLDFCPSLPTVPSDHERCYFVDRLLRIPRVEMKEFEGLSKEETIQRVTSMGNFLNQGNPWCNDDRPFSRLRKSLGFWKAIGANRSILSWISYGFQMRFARYPQRMMFSNSPTTLEHEKFIDQEIKTHLEDGSFIEVPSQDVWVVNPFIISVNSSGKPRRCDDMRFVNAHMASPIFKMQTLDRDLPNIVRPSDHMFTRDLAKAYYKVPISEQSTKFQCFYWKGKVL